MREIKFRAWYKGDEFEWFENGKPRMIYNIEGSYDGSGFDDKENGFGWVSCFSDFIENESVVVMQYTGLKDKNGTEIYEGDVIKYIIKKPMLPEMYVVTSMTNYDEMAVLKEMAENNTTIIEVIGNIYEHPHLLGD